jgi:cytoskeleton protein RodZ
MRGVSLDEIAESTKIGTRLLKALEDEQFDLLPGGIFNKGFVRAYAKYLGMDEEQAVADYLQAAGNEDPDAALVAQQGEWDQSRYVEPASESRRCFPFVPVLVLAVVVVAGFGGWKIYEQHMQQRQVSQAEREVLQASETSSAASAPTVNNTTDTSTAQPSSGSAATRPESPAAPSNTLTRNSSAVASGFEVEVKTTGRAWLGLKADGETVVRGVLNAGQSRTLHAGKEIVVVTGNAGATQVFFQGKPVLVQGGVNEARTLVFTSNGLQPTPSSDVRPAGESSKQPSGETAHPPQ